MTHQVLLMDFQIRNSRSKVDFYKHNAIEIEWIPSINVALFHKLSIGFHCKKNQLLDEFPSHVVFQNQKLPCKQLKIVY